MNEFTSIKEFTAALIGELLRESPYEPQRILKSGNRTIVFWADGKKTVVKRADDEPDNTYIAFTAALAKRIYGSNSAVQKIIKEKVEVREAKHDKN